MSVLRAEPCKLGAPFYALDPVHAAESLHPARDRRIAVLLTLVLDLGQLAREPFIQNDALQITLIK
ncbi:hypothetical protein [Methylobacterium sp. WSM2598]|uniref:hypothetical protein n=1 Tax=Methylobacterium sp. WSM2598 TaxID=398261 RepID=UPI00037D0367|nr:hypothetical protein [Methylobacterium sp. WSM2598]